MKKLILGIIVLLFIGCGEEESSSVSVTTQKMLEPTPYSKVISKIGKKPILLEFGSTSCASCVQMGKILQAVKEKHPSSEIYFIDVYQDREAMKNFGIQMIPTQVYVSREGHEVDRHIGLIEYENLVVKLKKEKII